MSSLSPEYLALATCNDDVQVPSTTSAGKVSQSGIERAYLFDKATFDGLCFLYQRRHPPGPWVGLGNSRVSPSMSIRGLLSSGFVVVVGQPNTTWNDVVQVPGTTSISIFY